MASAIKRLAKVCINNIHLHVIFKCIECMTCEFQNGSCHIRWWISGCTGARNRRSVKNRGRRQITWRPFYVLHSHVFTVAHFTMSTDGFTSRHATSCYYAVHFAEVCQIISRSSNRNLQLCTIHTATCIIPWKISSLVNRLNNFKCRHLSPRTITVCVRRSVDLPWVDSILGCTKLPINQQCT